jgi:hypothetical protein
MSAASQQDAQNYVNTAMSDPMFAEAYRAARPFGALRDGESGDDFKRRMEQVKGKPWAQIEAEASEAIRQYTAKYGKAPGLVVDQYYRDHKRPSGWATPQAEDGNLGFRKESFSESAWKIPLTMALIAGGAFAAPAVIGAIGGAAGAGGAGATGAATGAGATGAAGAGGAAGAAGAALPFSTAATLAPTAATTAGTASILGATVPAAAPAVAGGGGAAGAAGWGSRIASGYGQYKDIASQAASLYGAYQQHKDTQPNRDIIKKILEEYNRTQPYRDIVRDARYQRLPAYNQLAATLMPSNTGRQNPNPAGGGEPPAWNWPVYPG